VAAVSLVITARLSIFTSPAARRRKHNRRPRVCVTCLEVVSLLGAGMARSRVRTILIDDLVHEASDRRADNSQI
jgi:hypothetical protein